MEPPAELLAIMREWAESYGYEITKRDPGPSGGDEGEPAPSGTNEQNK
jgi:hypothetical protein